MSRICEGVGIVVLCSGLVAWAGELPGPAANPGCQPTEEVELLAARLTFALGVNLTPQQMADLIAFISIRR